MRVQWLLVLFFFSLSAWAQQAKLVSAPTPNLQPDSSDAYTHSFLLSSSPTADRHVWYWEEKNWGPATSGLDRFLSIKPKVNNDFSPASLQWTFTGKRKLMPVLDLTVIQFKPGETSFIQKPAASTSAPDRSSLRAKATHSLMDFLQH